MPGLHPCLEPRCPVLVRSGRCDAHGGPATRWGKRVTALATPRLGRSRSEARKKRLLAREPLCRPCAQEGRASIATIRDHVVPLAEGGCEDTCDNEQPICQPCHQAKTAEESKRGVRREW